MENTYLLWNIPAPLNHAVIRLFTVIWLGNIIQTLQFCKTSHVSTLLPGFGPNEHSHSHSPGLEDDYILLIPVKVDANGAYLSHDLTHRSRRKRSQREGQRAAETLHYKLTFLGRELQLDLSPSNLLSEDFTVQTLGPGGIFRTQAFRPSVDCLYQGSIRNEKPSAVALSTCGGLSGLVRSQQIEYLITPLPHHLALSRNHTWSPGHRPHVLYRRSAERSVQVAAGQTLRHQHNNNNNSRQQEQERHRQHRPHRHQPSHLRHPTEPQKQHFCGWRKKYMPQPPMQDAQLSLDERDPEMRWKRSVLDSRKRQGLTVEILVVADKRMLEKHGNENITTYVLTVMNMVSSLFKDGTIGTDIRIAIVSLLLLEQNPAGLVVNHHADQSLNSFCQWQAGLTGKNGKRHDHAVLLTGLDICSWKNEPCDTLGFAPISGMCSKHRSCTINEDTGLGLAFTIAHESGHNFGMIHDGEGNPCRKTEGNIMSPTLAGNNGIFSWSACSRQYLNRFLSTAQASCLVDEPKQTREYRYPSELPGQMYDADTQCKWQFGPKAKLCSLDFVKDICKALWCHRSGHRCETKFMPAAEGTVCGLNMWCRRGQCLMFGDEGPQPIHGQWSPWSEWSECSRTCGGGVTYKERHCDRPKPQYGGRFCAGSSRVYRICDAQPCRLHAISFRAQQCAEYNSRPFRGWYYKWRPYLKVEEEDICKLYCIAEDFDFFFAMSSKVKDGTPCVENKFDVCIDGICQAVGCDRMLGSNAVVDACGVCHGDNSTCTFFRGHYRHQHRANEYYSVVTVPPGARSIRVYELDISTSYLAVKSAKGKYYLTGEWTVDWPGKFTFAGALFHYHRSFNKPETLYSAGPTNETLLFEILLQGKNPGIGWEYTLAKAGNESQADHNHTWFVKRSDCSASCAGGKMLTAAYCLQDHLTPVNSSLCELRRRPPTGTTTCNTQPCPASWSTGKWSECSRSCGGGQQTRPVQCFRKASFQRDEAVPRSMCPLVAPSQLQPCNSHQCPPEWNNGAWSQCSKTCGRGLRKRNVFCRSAKSPASSWTPRGPAVVGPGLQCHPKLKPKSQEVCVLRRCPKNERLRWITSAWSECSVTCGGGGLQRRGLKCAEKTLSGEYVEFPQRRCRHLSKPEAPLEQGCQPGACLNKPSHPQPNKPPRVPPPVLGNPASAWYASPWQQCTVTCGGGVQTRSAHCLRQGRPANGCLPHQRPSMSRACHTNYCPSPRKDLNCVDFFSWCHLVPQHGVCGHKFYGKQCCKSCSKRGR